MFLIARKVRRKVHEKRKVLFTAVMVLAGLQLLSGCGKTEASANDTVVLPVLIHISEPTRLALNL
ncbi:hypothetical protein GIR35_15065 [Enterococcus faecalis]|nr:hypothetical protein GIR35_15065 [Enterococcus faecalis]